jgi:two-component system sensor histidine kinase UhpB
MSLRYQINLGIFITLIVILVIGSAAAIWQARASVYAEVNSSVNLALQLIKLGEAGETRLPIDQNPWLRKIISLEQTRHVQIQLKPTMGSMVQIKSGASQRERSSPPVWFVWAVSGDYPAVTYRLPGADAEPVSVVISADPSDEIMESWRETRAFFWVVLALSAGLFAGVNLAFRQVLNSVAVILQGLDALEREHYQNRLPRFRTLEFNRIAGAINHLTATLEKARQDNNALTLHSLQIQEDERRRLAQELHDELGQSLTAIKVMAVTAQKPNADRQTIHASIVSVCEHLFQVVRGMMKSLHPLMLTELGLKASLEELVASWAFRNPEIRFALQCPEVLDELDASISIQLFRVVQECITNTVRHAGANTLSIDLCWDASASGEMVRLSVRDDGVGCDPARLNSGFGLKGIKARVKSLGGTVEFESAEPHGMALSISIPVV